MKPPRRVVGPDVIDSDLYKLLGRRLKARRRRLCLTQSDIARVCGITFQQIQKYEAGATKLSVGKLLRLASALDTSAASLLERLEGLAAPVPPPECADVSPGDAQVTQALQSGLDGGEGTRPSSDATH